MKAAEKNDSSKRKVEKKQKEVTSQSGTTLKFLNDGFITKKLSEFYIKRLVQIAKKINRPKNLCWVLLIIEEWIHL